MASAASPRTLPIALGLQILGIAANGSWHLWYPDLSFGMLRAGGFCDDLGTLGSTTKDAWRSRLEVSLICCGFRDTISTKKMCLFMLVSRLLFLVIFKSVWMSGIGKPSISLGRYCKDQLSQKLDFP